MSKALIVAGMHRSGTSLVANMIHSSGIPMGDELLPPDVGNPLGYFEDVEIHDFHRVLLRRAGVRDAFTVTESDVPIVVDDEARDHAVQFAERRSSRPQWGWKEPRTSLFLDLWNGVLADKTFLFLFREPTAVLDSLLRRASNDSVNKDPVVGLRLWRIYNEHILRFAKAHPDLCILAETNRFIRSPDAVAGALALRGFDVDPGRIGDVFVEDAFHVEVRMRARRVAKKNRDEGRRCAELYAELRAVSLP